MKSLYFTSKLIEPQAEEFQSLVDLKKHRSHTWRRPALLVLDMQQYFLHEDSHAFVPSAPAIIPGMIQLVDLFLQVAFPVLFTRHINSKEDAGNMSFWWRDLITIDHPHSGLIEPFSRFDKDATIKTQYDAFLGTSLQQQLDALQVTDVIITGVMTHLCCETTARSAFMRGYQVWFPVDGTATYNPDFHLGSLRNLAHGFAHIPLMRDLIMLAGSPMELK